MNDNIDGSQALIQVVSAIAVVTLHTNGCFWQFSSTERYWITANIIESVFYFAVPAFFMLTGCNLLDYRGRYSTKDYIKKRVQKTVIPYVVWSLIGVVYLLITGRVDAESVTFKWIVNGLLSTGDIVGVYWFFKPLFCCYLAIPLFASIEYQEKKFIAKYLILLGGIINICIPFLNNLIGGSINWTYKIDVIAGYLFWLWVGWYICKFPPDKRFKRIIYIGGAVGLLMHILGTYYYSIEAGSIQKLFKGYNNLPCILYSVAAFVFLRDLGGRIKNKKAIRGIAFLSRYTFALYLMHWFIIRIISSIFIINPKSIVYRLITPYIIFIIVIAIVSVLRKIPGLKSIVP